MEVPEKEYTTSLQSPEPSCRAPRRRSAAPSRPPGQPLGLPLGEDHDQPLVPAKDHDGKKQKDAAKAGEKGDQHKGRVAVLFPVPDVHPKDAADDADQGDGKGRRGQNQLQLNQLIPVMIQLNVDEILRVVNVLAQIAELVEEVVHED